MKLTNTLNANNFQVVNLANGVNPQDAVTYAQLQAAQMGWSWKLPVRVATSGNITLSGLQTIDGISLVAGDRVLVKNQTTASANGIYVAASGSWALSNDFNLSSEVPDATMIVNAGTTLAGTQWTMTTSGPVTLGTTALTFSQTGGSQMYSAGSGILFTSGVISADPSVVARKASATIGDGTSTTISVTHGLNTQDIIVSVREVSTNTAVLVDWVANGVNTVQLTFGLAPTIGQYRVTVVA